MLVPVTFGAAGKVSSLSPAYRWMLRPICRILLMQYVRFADACARDKAGSNKAARTARMAITTKSSIKVKPALVWRFAVTLALIVHRAMPHAGAERAEIGRAHV